MVLYEFEVKKVVAFMVSTNFEFVFRFFETESLHPMM